MSFLQRVIFKTTLIYGKTLAQLGYRDWYTRIDERVILGMQFILYHNVMSGKFKCLVEFFDFMHKFNTY